MYFAPENLTIKAFTEHSRLEGESTMSGDKFADEFYDSSAYTADISTKMRIPEHINAHGSLSNGEGGHGGKSNSALYDMQVPDR